MIECPQCNNNITGYRCSCGYTVPSAKYSSDHIHRDKNKDDADHLRECQVWLMNQGITNKNMTSDEWQEATAAYRNKIAKLDKPDGKDWARKLLSDFADGEMISHLQERYAKEALGIKYEEM